MEKGMKIKTLILTATLSSRCDTAFICFWSETTPSEKGD